MSVRYPFPNYTISTINPTDREICTPTAPDGGCYFVALAICYPKGVATCEADPDFGNTGNNNDGMFNFGNNNGGSFNHGNGNIGSHNRGSNNIGSNIVCNNWASDAPCPIANLKTTETITLAGYPPPPPPPSPPPPSPPPSQVCDPRNPILALPTIGYLGSLYLASSTDPDAYCRNSQTAPTPTPNNVAGGRGTQQQDIGSRSCPGAPSTFTAIAAVSLKVTPAPLSQAITAPLSKAIAAVSRKVTPAPLSQTITATFRQEAATTLPQAIATSSEQEATTPFSQAAISTAHQEKPTPFREGIIPFNKEILTTS
ncbi:hypothetical protein APUTEX25_001173, partial [Auxenochlorella protothecoides]